MTNTIRIFLASSEELVKEREAFEIFIYRKCKEWKRHNVFFELIIWEDFIDVLSKTRLQDEYNKAIKECQIFVMLFWNKVGKYTEEEFETAFRHFQENDKPFILTYFKDSPSNIPKEPSLASFQEKLKSLGHFYTRFKNTEWLFVHFGAQLEKLYADDFKKFIPDDEDVKQKADKIYRPVNSLLTKNLIEAIQPYSKNARDFITNANRRTEWETNTTISNVAQDILSYSFVGVLGIQLRKLFAIGKSEYTEAKQTSYITNCTLTLKRALQLICFTLISRLWDHKKTDISSLPDEKAAIIRQFFEDQFELDNDTYLELLMTLLSVFDDLQLKLPIPELEDLFDNEQLKNEFLNACAGLRKISLSADKNELGQFSSLDAETNLSKILCLLAFLASYKMVSIKSIYYDEMRYTPPRYIHNYVSIGIDNKLKVNSEKINYMDSPVNTDVILLYKDEYRQSINLFPFIIDMNSLTFEGGSKICFYSCQDVSDNSLNYVFPEDNSVLNIGFTNAITTTTNINDLMLDIGKRKLVKLDKAYSLFQEAKNTILEQDLQNIEPA